MHRIRVVVLGGGYAGLAFARGLRQTGVDNLEITLVDRNQNHTLLTETHTVAAGTRPTASVEVPFAPVCEGIHLVTAAVLSVDVGAKQVLTDTGALPFDYLAFCLGGRDNHFNIPGVREHARFLRGAQDAEAIRTRLETMGDTGNVVVVGGGLTGVELAAEMALHWGARRTVTLVEASPHLLPGLPPALQDRARRRLGWLGVNVLTGRMVRQITHDHVHLSDRTNLNSGLTVWCAGVQGHPLVAEMGAATGRDGRAQVDAHLRSSLENVYVLGDSAAFGTPPLPPSGQLAEQMGLYAAAALGARLHGKEHPPFAPRLKGVLCDLGGVNATGLIYKLQVHGRLAALAKRATVLGHLWRVTGYKGLLHHLRSGAHAGAPQKAEWRGER